MIAICSSCTRSYWKYRGDWETPAFCSWLCHDVAIDARRARSIGDGAGPGIPIAIVELIRSHTRIAHRPRNPIVNGVYVGHPDDWPECAECERLEAKLAAAIAWHSPAIGGTHAAD